MRNSIRRSFGDGRVALDHRPLHLDGAAHRVDNAGEFDSSPSPVVLTMRPLCSAIFGSTSSRRMRLQRGRACLPRRRPSAANSPPHRRRGSRRGGGSRPLWAPDAAPDASRLQPHDGSPYLSRLRRPARRARTRQLPLASETFSSDAEHRVSIRAGGGSRAPVSDRAEFCRDRANRSGNGGHVKEVNDEIGIQWLFSFLSADKRKTYCLYEAPNAEAIRAAAQRLGVPADTIVEVGAKLAPMPGCLRRFGTAAMRK